MFVDYGNTKGKKFHPLFFYLEVPAIREHNPYDNCLDKSTIHLYLKRLKFDLAIKDYFFHSAILLINRGVYIQESNAHKYFYRPYLHNEDSHWEAFPHFQPCFW